MRHVVVDTNGDVVNVVEWDGQTDWLPDDTTHIVYKYDGEVGAGWHWNNGSPINPNPPPMPPVLSAEPKSPAEKLALAGLTVNDLKTLLNLP